MKLKHYIDKRLPRLDHKRIAVFGATGVLGTALIDLLIQKGAHVLASGRNPERLQCLQKKYLNALETFVLDFSDFESIQGGVKKLNKIPLDYLFINSGLYTHPTTTMELNKHCMVNALGPYFLIKELLPWLDSNGTLIVTTTSLSCYHQKSAYDWKMDKPKKSTDIYGQTKLLQLQLMKRLEEMALEQYPNVTFRYAHPGITATKISLALHPITGVFISLFAMPASKAVLNLLYAAVEPIKQEHWVCPRGPFQLIGYPKEKRIKKKKCFISEHSISKIEEIEKRGKEAHEF